MTALVAFDCPSCGGHNVPSPPAERLVCACQACGSSLLLDGQNVYALASTFGAVRVGEEADRAAALAATEASKPEPYVWRPPPCALCGGDNDRASRDYDGEDHDVCSACADVIDCQRPLPATDEERAQFRARLSILAQANPALDPLPDVVVQESGRRVGDPPPAENPSARRAWLLARYERVHAVCDALLALDEADRMGQLATFRGHLARIGAELSIVERVLYAAARST